MDKMAEWMFYRNLGLKPFDPKTNKQQDVGHGGPSTERLMTIGDGQYEPIKNIPAIWFNQEGKPIELAPDTAIALSQMAERQEGKQMPTYRTIEDAVKAAEFRSANGGANQESIWDWGRRTIESNRRFRR